MAEEAQRIDALEQQIAALTPVFAGVREEIAKVVVGQQDLVDRLLVGLLADGHLLLEGLPGLAKTTAVKALADTLDAEFTRIQFTPDLLPADLVGTQIYDPKSGEFHTRKGPLFGNIVLADEINRAPAKVQSALLEAMEERQVTLGDETYPLPSPFLVLATQNPIEQEGTYPLPEAQVDRFLMKVRVSYPGREEEREIMRRDIQAPPALQSVLGPSQLQDARRVVRAVAMEAVVASYILDLVRATRTPTAFGIELASLVEFGASPRASLALAGAARSMAFLEGRGFVTPDDVKSVAPDVLRHRILLTYEAEAMEVDADAVIQDLLEHVPTP